MINGMKHAARLLALFTFFAAGLGAQTHSSVSLEETDLYRLLEIAEISGMIDRLPAARPLPRSAVKRALQQIESFRDKLTDWQNSVLADYLERFAEDEEKPFLQDGDLRIEDETFPLNWQFYSKIETSVDAAQTRQFGIHNILGGVFSGDLGKHVSYGFDLSFQLNKVHIDDNAPYPYAWTPYTYTKSWDGGARYLDAPVAEYHMPKEWSMGWAMYPEIVLSWWENRVDFRFGRMRRDWGFGEGNLFLDKKAHPFMGLEGTLSPWKWLSLTFLFGGLEYGPSFRNSPFVSGQYPETTNGTNETLGTREVSLVQQNMLSIFRLEVKPAKWLSVSLYDAVIYPKRLELAYMFPFMSKLFAQGNHGDFDNMLFGGTISLSWPGLFRTYGTILIDEWQPSIPLNSLRNQLAVQAGIKAVIPMKIWSLLTFQYTKIEPFTYTHYAINDLPWYDKDLEMEIGYLNHGSNIGSYLEPNSDEFLLSFHVQPSRSWTAGFTYRLIRHGGLDVPGSSYDSWGYTSSGSRPDDDPNGAYYENGTKDFLKDGTYEWFHIFSLGASVDFRSFLVPVQLSLQYSFVYEYDSDYSANSNFSAIAGTELFRNLFTIKVKLWAK